MLKQRFTATRSWASRHPRRFLAYLIGSIVGVLLLVQLFYPAGTLVPFSTVDSVALGGMSKKAAITLLDKKFSTATVGVYINDSETALFKTTPTELGITSSNDARIQTISYPWYLRLVPTSLFWVHELNEDVADLTYQRNQAVLTAYLGSTVGDNCQLNVRNATVTVKDKTLVPTEAFSGGSCDATALNEALVAVKPTVTGARVSIEGEEVKPRVSTAEAKTLAEHVTTVLEKGIAVSNGKDDTTIPKDILRTWLDFGIVDEKLSYSFSIERSASYLGERIASEVEKPIGETTIKLKDFAEVGRDEGQSGVVFNQAAMLASIKTALEKGDTKVAVEVTTTAPTIKYTRSYSPSDKTLSAMLKTYADTHPGTYGVSLRELSGQRRNASYRATTQYTTASTYKLFVAYSTLLRVESGQWKWTDQINGGRDLTECFNDMIQLSDNECAVALLKKATAKSITNEAHAVGAIHTSFLVTNSIKSTPEDESLLLGLLESGQLLTQQSSRDVWIAAMKKNVYRQGIPKGIPSSVVADKVGFLDAWLHDAAIVYSPKGAYVLVIMTESSSWANIAQLAGQIEAAR
jgi:beta-lactamase class A